MDYIKSFGEILDRFSTGQRVFVLILLLVFSSSTYLGAHYMKADSCSEVVNENRQLVEDYMAIYKMLKVQTEYEKQTKDMPTISEAEPIEVSRSPAGVVEVETEDTTMIVKSISKDSINNMILQIAERNIERNKRE